MRPFPEITDQDVILLTGAEFLVDRKWKEEFGQEIEYRYRVIPFHLVYMLAKYGSVITHSVFVDSIQDVCGLSKRDEKYALRKDRLGLDRANNLINEVVRLGLISRVKPREDKRFCLYRVSDEQLQKLHRIREATIEIYNITAAQAKNPNDAECGRTEENKTWCANIKTERMMTHDDLYHATKRRLDKWRHLGSAVLVFFVFGGMVFLASAAAATINGGGY